MDFGREEGLNFYEGEGKRIESLDFQSVVSELKGHYKLDSKKNIIRSVQDNGLFNV